MNLKYLASNTVSSKHKYCAVCNNRTQPYAERELRFYTWTENSKRIIGQPICMSCSLVFDMYNKQSLILNKNIFKIVADFADLTFRMDKSYYFYNRHPAILNFKTVKSKKVLDEEKFEKHTKGVLLKQDKICVKKHIFYLFKTNKSYARFCKFKQHLLNIK